MHIFATAPVTQAPEFSVEKPRVSERGYRFPAEIKCMVNESAEMQIGFKLSEAREFATKLLAACDEADAAEAALTAEIDAAKIATLAAAQ